jgi:hypothetical protein
MSLKGKFKLVRISFFSLLIFSIFTFPLSSFSVQTGHQLNLSPFLNWLTLQTDHFSIHFPEGLEEGAKKAALHLEEAHEVLTPVFRWTPRHRTEVLLLDNSDQANGLAGAQFRFGLILWLTPPDNWSSISYYDDWLRLLTFHEYTHTLNLDPTRTWMEAFRIFYGDGIRPNALWPRWLTEGFAVYIETRFTQAGRGRSPYYEMLLRTAVYEDALGKKDHISLDRIHGDYPEYPSGGIPYVYGYHMTHQILKDADLDFPTLTHDKKDIIQDDLAILGLLSYRSAGRVPFFLNSNLRNITGKSFIHYWSTWRDQTNLRMKEQIKTLNSAPLTKEKKLIHQGYQTLACDVSPDGKLLAYHLETKDSPMALYVYNIENQERKKIGNRFGANGIAFTQDSRHVIYSERIQKGQYAVYNDLFAYNRETHKTHRLTYGLRTREPQISPDGKKIAFTISDKGEFKLIEASLEVKKGQIKIKDMETLFSPGPLGTVFTPTYSPDGIQIVFSSHENGKAREDLWVLNRETGDASVLMQKDGIYHRFPRFSKQGELYYVANLNGVDNLYRHNATESQNENQSTDQVTHFISGVRHFCLPNQEEQNSFFAAHFDLQGWSLKEFSLAKTPYSTQDLLVKPPDAPAVEGSIEKNLHLFLHDTVSENPENQLGSEIRKYSAFRTLRPRGWAPFLYANNLGLEAGGSVSGFDSLHQHSYFATAAYSTFTSLPSFRLNYQNRSLGPTLSFDARYHTPLWQSKTTAGEWFSAERLWHHRRFALSTTVFFPFQWQFHQLTPSLTAEIERTTPISGTESAPGLLRDDFIPNLTVGLSYSKGNSSRYAIVKEDGHRLSLFSSAYFLDDQTVLKNFIHGKKFFHLGRHFVLAPSLSAAWSSEPSTLPSANVLVRGRRLYSFEGSLPSANRGLQEITLRGYPGFGFQAREAYSNSWEIFFPLKRIYRGLHNYPFFIRELGGYGFTDFVWTQSSLENTDFLTSSGAGVALDGTVFGNAPFTFHAGYHVGFNERAGGKGEWVFDILFNLF